MAKRLTSSAVNWSFIMDTLPAVDKTRLNPLKMSSDKYLREIFSKPADLPKIDWNYYKGKVSASDMVNTFQKNYEGLKIPYPSDKGALAETEKLNSKIKKFADEKEASILKQIEELKMKLKELESVMKYSEMTMEELFLIKPELRNDVDHPKLWPHFIKDEDLKEN